MFPPTPFLSQPGTGLIKKIQKIKQQKIEHTTAGIRWSSPTQLLICRSAACLWESRRDPEFSTAYGRMWKITEQMSYISNLLNVPKAGPDA